MHRGIDKGPCSTLDFRQFERCPGDFTLESLRFAAGA